MRHFFISITALIACLAGYSPATLAKPSAQDLFMKSSASLDRNIRNAGLQQIMIEYPYSAEALYAQSLFTYYNSGDEAKEKQLLEQALAQNPNLYTAAHNMSIVHDWKTEKPKVAQYKRQAFEGAMKLNSDKFDSYGMYYYFFIEDNFPEKTSSIIKRLDHSDERGKSILNLIEGRKAIQAKKYHNAIVILTKLEGRTGLEHVEQFFYALKSYQQQQGLSQNESVALGEKYLKKLATKYQNDQTSDIVMGAAIKKLADFIGEICSVCTSSQIQLYQYAYEMGNYHNSLEAYQRALSAQEETQAAIELVDSALKTAPGIGAYQAALNLAFYIGDLELAVSNYNRLIELIPINDHAVSQAVNFSNDLFRMTGSNQGAIALLEDLLNKRQLQTKQLRTVWLELANFYLNQQDFTKTKKYLEKYEKSGDPNRYTLTFHQLIQKLEQAKQQKDSFYSQNPFMANWDDVYHGRLSLNIEYETNSAQIKPLSYPSLKKAAALLKTAGAQNYLFEIGGHTDNTGSDTINVPLSERRAESVRRYFVEQAGVSPTRLKAAGFGSHYPVASNQTEAGRKQNRRVEIVPLGSLSSPQVAGIGQINSSWSSFSPDGRYAVTGTQPLALFDLQKGVKIGNLAFEGGHRFFAPDNRHVAIVSNFKNEWGVTSSSVYFVDIKTRLVKGVFLDAADSSLGSGLELVWSPFGNEVAILTQYGYVYVIDASTGKTVRSAKSAERAVGGHIAWSPDGEFIVVAPGYSETLEVFNAQSMEFEGYVEGVNYAHALAFNPWKNELVAINNDSSITVIDYPSFQLKKIFRSRFGGARSLQTIPGTSQYVVERGFGENYLYLLDTDTEVQRKIYEAKGDKSLAYKVSHNGELLLADGEEILRYPDINTQGSPMNAITASSNFGRQLFVDKANDLAVTVDSERIAIWRISQGRQLDVFESPAPYWLKLNKPHLLAGFNKDGEVYLLDLSTLKIKSVAQLKFQPTIAAFHRDKLVFAGIPLGSGYRKNPSETGYAAVLNSETFRTLSQTEFSLESQRSKTGALANSGIQTLTISPDGETFALVTWINDQRESTASKLINLFDISTGKLKDKIDYGSEIVSVQRTEDDKDFWLQVSGQYTTKKFSPSSGKSKALPYQSSKRDGSVAQNEDLSYSMNVLYLGDKSLILNTQIQGAYADASRNLLLIYTRDNELHFYSYHELKNYLTIASIKQGKWLAYTQDGFFTASLDATKDVYWSFGDDYLPFEALADKKERPRLIQQRLEALLSGRTVDQNEPIADDDVINAPFKLILLTKKQISTDQDTYEIQVKVEKESKSAPDPEVRFILNQRKSRGFEEEAFFDDAETLTFTRNVPLVEGLNNVDIELYFKGVRVLSENVEITRKHIKRTDALKGNLWFFGVGVSEYQNSLQNLEFAHKDAEALAKSFKNQEGKLYRQVHTRVITNQEATARNVNIGLNEFLADAGPEDQVVIFIAGHGVQDNSQQLYFITHDADVKKPYTGLDMNLFRNFLNSRPLNQTVLFAMDICHSGSFERSVSTRTNSGDVTKLLGEGTATTVLASSQGAQLSYESEEFGGGHGAFTYAILEGLSGKADREVGDENGLVSLIELISYSKRLVPRLTNKAQQPHVAEAASFSDYPLAKFEL